MALFPLASPDQGGSKMDEPYVDVVNNEADHSKQRTDGLHKTGKHYNCQRCLNHGLHVPRKNHKRNCLYADCICDHCELVQSRKILNREIIKESVSNEPESVTPPPEIVPEKVPLRTRLPKCSRCRSHNPTGDPPPLKGHKKSCPYQKCTCRKCTLITSRREVMAKQIRLRRCIFRRQIARRRMGSAAEAERMDTLDSGISSPSPEMTRLGSCTNHQFQKEARSSADACGKQARVFHQCDQDHVIENKDAEPASNRCHCTYVGQECASSCSQHRSNALPITQSGEFVSPGSVASAHTLFAGFLEYVKNVLAPSALQSANRSSQAGGLALPTSLAANSGLLLDGMTLPLMHQPNHPSWGPTHPAIFPQMMSPALFVPEGTESPRFPAIGNALQAPYPCDWPRLYLSHIRQ